MTKKKFHIVGHEVLQQIYIVEADSLEEALEMVEEEDVSIAHEEVVYRTVDEAEEIKYV